jgi:ElaB/YqjD/DUF883 family membrane-anchored ribosome-binding protein
MNTQTASSAKTPEELLDDLRKLVNEAEAMLSDSAGGHSADMVDSLRARFEAAQERLAHAYTKARQKVTAGAHNADEAIHEHPYQAIAVAAGIGVLVGVLIGRNSKS